MAPMDGARLTIGGDSFYMLGGVEVAPRVRTGYLLDNQGSTTMAIINSLFGDSDLFGGLDQRKGLFLDLGGGEHIVQIEWRGWEGADLEWGGAAGEDPSTQMDVFMQSIITTQIDSFRPAMLEYGEHHAGGRYSPVPVALEGPEVTRNAQNPSTYDGSMVCIATATFDSDTYLSALKAL